MNALGISINDFDTIVISHNHSDHVGGGKWAKEKTFSLSAHQIDLGQKTVYTPIPMTYPGLCPICTENPTVISKGIATIGAISNYLFQTKDLKVVGLSRHDSSETSIAALRTAFPTEYIEIKVGQSITI